MKKRKIIQFVIAAALLLTGILFGGARLMAAGLDTSEAGDEDSIGRFDDRAGGYSHVGVKVYWEDELENFALDTYKKSDNNVWQYVLSNVNGTVMSAETSYRGNDSPIWLCNTNNASGRFKLRSEMIKKGRKDYSNYVEYYLNGELKWTGYEIAGLPDGNYGTSTCGANSFKQDDSPAVGGFSATGASIVYRVYDARSIGPDGDELSLDANGGEVEENGKAYYRKDGLLLMKLPVVSMNKPGCTCTFEGWYSAAEGGRKYQVGDVLQRGDTLHARWNVTPKKYDVICVDIRGDGPDGEELGRTSWKAEFGTTARASAAGTNQAVGAYYAHCCYKDYTTAQVTENGATVYRYFSYESCPVEYIDQIEEGSRQGETLDSSRQQKEYSTTVHGSDIGMDTAPGAYYQGYCYTHCTSEQVREQGTVVYRYFKPVRYTIVMDGNGATEGQMNSIENCLYDSPVTLEASSFRKDSTLTLYQDGKKNPAETSQMTVRHKFLGWATKRDGAVRFADGEIIRNISAQNGTVTLYAVWSVENVTLPSLAATMGHQFSGWAKEADARTGMMQAEVADSMELYAIWNKEAVKYHVECYKENLEGGYDLAASYQFDGYSGSEVSADTMDLASPGFSLDEASSRLRGTVKADGSLVLYAYFRRNSYHFQYDLNGGALDPGDELTIDKVKFGTNIILPAVIPHRDDCLFQGWYEATDGTHALLRPRDSFVMQNHDVVLRAQWKKTSFKIKYDNNAEYSRLTGITGNVPDTDYIYQKDSFASSELYQSDDAEMMFWNTKPDGSGVSVLPGTNLKGLFDSEDGLTLYAVWKRNNSDEYVSFRLKLLKDKEGGKETVDTLKLYGKPGERISVALLRLYQKELSGESVIYFYRGYEVVNAQELERVISKESDTEISLTVKERKCTVSFPSGKGDGVDSLQGITGNYHDKFTLPDSFADGTKIDRYEDNEGNHYMPGDTITLERNMQLYPQHAVHLHDEKGGEKDRIVYVNRGEDYVLPDLSVNGYRLLGWSDSMGESVGKAGQVMKNITRRCDFYARWSEPLTYRITYDLGDTGIKILENSVTYYQYTKGAVLPDASQVTVPEGYQFDGWYDSKDANMTMISRISSTEYGDKTLKPHLSKKDGDQNADDKKTGEDGKPSGSGDGEQKGDGSISGSGNGNQNGNGGTSGSGNGNQNGSGNSSGNGNTSGSGDGNGGTSSGNNNPFNLKQQSGIYSVGNTFWKGKLKYKIISSKNGKERIKVIAVKKKVKKVSIPSKVTYGKRSFRVTVIANKAFYKAKTVKVIVPKTVTKIGKRAFANMKRLKKVTLGTGLKSIGIKAFYNDKKLVNVVIKGTKLSKVGKSAFARINKKAVFRVPKKKQKAYSRKLKKSANRQVIVVKL